MGKDSPKLEDVEDVDPGSTIHLAVVACGDRLEETLVMLKSATIFTTLPLKFHIFTEDDLKEEFVKQVNRFFGPLFRSSQCGSESKVEYTATWGCCL